MSLDKTGFTFARMLLAMAVVAPVAAGNYKGYGVTQNTILATVTFCATLAGSVVGFYSGRICKTAHNRMYRRYTSIACTRNSCVTGMLIGGLVAGGLAFGIAARCITEPSANPAPQSSLAPVRVNAPFATLAAPHYAT